MSTKSKTIIYKAWAWLTGVLLLGLVGGTVLVTDNSMPVDLQGSQWRWLCAVMIIVLPWWLVGCIINLRQTVFTVSEVVEWVLMGLGAVEALHGLGQAAGIYSSGHALFILTGTFYNSGPYSGYLAAVLPIALHKILSTNRQKDFSSRIQYYFSLCVLMLICCVLPAGMSRAAWVASLIACGYVAYRVYREAVNTFVLRHRYTVCGMLLLGVVCVVGVYFMKRESADGRLLIWKVTLQAVIANPMGEQFGRSFSALYGDAQERYFAKGIYSDSEVWVAGTPDFAFNEYLQIAAEYGVLLSAAFISVLVVLLLVARSHKHLTGMGGALVSLMVFACFSYPLHIPAIVSVVILVVMALCGEGLMRIKQSLITKMGLLLVVLVGFPVSVNRYKLCTERIQAVREWMSVRGMYYSGAFKTAVEEYGKQYVGMDWNKDFCFEYGRALYRDKHYREAEGILLRTMKLSGDPMILNILGRNSQDCGEYEKAENYLIRSIHRLPNRIYPHYLLVKLYALPEFYDREKLIKEAEWVLNKEPKVNSTAIREMRQEVKKIYLIEINKKEASEKQ